MPTDIRGRINYVAPLIHTLRLVEGLTMVISDLDSQAIVVLILPTLDRRDILANSSANAGVSSNLSRDTLEQRGECTRVFT